MFSIFGTFSIGMPKTSLHKKAKNHPQYEKPQYRKNTDTLRDCRKSPKMVALAISHVMISIT